MRYVSVELLRAWGTITRPPREGPGGPMTGVSLYVGSYIYFKLLPARNIEIRALARSRLLILPLRPARARAILIEPRYGRIERSIGIDRLEDLWSPRLVITIHEV